MEKFFLFRKEEINEDSSRSSDTGVGLSVLAIPTKHVSFMSAAKGSVIITFNDAGLYDKIELFDSEAIEKTAVTVSCSVGEELELLENVINFISNSNQHVLKFDVVKGASVFKKAVLSSSNDLSAKIRINPTVYSTGDISKGAPETQFQRTIAGVYFGGNPPALDFNHEGLSVYSDGAEITAWANAGTKGSRHSIVANVGDPSAATGLTASRGLSTVSANIAYDDYFVVPNAYTTPEDYTLYLAFLNNTSISGVGAIYGDDEGDSIGFCFSGPIFDSAGGIDKARIASNTFSVRHDGRIGEPASTQTNNSNHSTQSYQFPEIHFDPAAGETLQVFVIRRDKNANMYLHNRTGDLVGFIPSFTVLNTADSKSTTFDFMTDGALLIEQIGSAGGIVDAGTSPNKSFKGKLARFGVIEKDIGANASANLAQDLFKLYNF
tara:strand:+ start:19731 stop:21038 length:1308 start_codon:yes stop_codon:yes gene_type:complete